jgi:hypothetical protein
MQRMDLCRVGIEWLRSLHTERNFLKKRRQVKKAGINQSESLSSQFSSFSFNRKIIIPLETSYHIVDKQEPEHLEHCAGARLRHECAHGISMRTITVGKIDSNEWQQTLLSKVTRNMGTDCYF